MGDRAATTLFLVRHGAHDRLGRVLAGRMPGVSLGEAGWSQARRVADRLARERITALYASPLERCRETARPIAEALGLPVGLAHGLTEIDFGNWTGRALDTLGDDPRWRRWNEARASASPPGGEPMAAVQARALAEIEAWRAAHPDAGVAAVSHGDVIKAVVCGVLGLSLDRHHAFEVDPASLTTLVVWPGGGKLLRLNEGATP